MTFKYRSVSVSRLLLDQSNARLGEPQPQTQQATQIALAKIVGNQLFEIAEDIVTHGLDPTTIPAITPEGATGNKFRVIEGNRRVLAIKSLETPGILEAALTSARLKRLNDLSELFRRDPISSVLCVVFDTEDEARHWIELRHTGANNGIGLVEWDSNEQDRYKARHGRPESRKPPGQIIDFVNTAYPPTPGDKRIFTTLDRVISTPFVRERLGIHIENGIVYSYFPGPEVIKGLSTIVLDLRAGRKKVNDVYYENDRKDYIDELTAEQLPNPVTRLDQPRVLALLSAHENSPNEAGAGSSGTSADSAVPAPRQSAEDTQPATQPTGLGAAAPSNQPGPGPANSTGNLVGGTSAGATRPSRVKPPRRRSTTIPASCVLWIATQSRINAIYHELVRLDVDQFTNACAVLLRVFVELTTDHHIALHNTIPEAQRRSTSLAAKLKSLADSLNQQNQIDSQLKTAVHKVANGANMLSASTVTFNQYVHNQYAFPQPSELCTAWDELQPFMQVLWKK